MKKNGIFFIEFLPGVSREAVQHIRKTIRKWKVQLKNSLEFADLSAKFNLILRGLENYYSRFYKKAMTPVWHHVNYYLVQWIKIKYKHLCKHKTEAGIKLKLLTQEMPNASVHWKAGHRYASMAG